jgi:S-adenosylmethionine decarboxylase proenzyme
VDRKPGGFAKHVILELWEASNTNSASTVRRALREACECGKLRLDKLLIHQFSPHGVSAVAMIAESHIAIHTWPEYAFAAVDIYSSDSDADIDKVAEAIVSAFSPCHANQVKMRRGPGRSGTGGIPKA